jgi:YD repeat-containing protein
MRHRRALVAVAAATAGLTAAPARAADHTMSFPYGFGPVQYSPQPDITVDANDTVTFDGDFSYHPLVWTDGDFETQQTDTTKQFTFTRPGLYRFHCAIHGATMTGSISVPGNQFATPDFSFAPAAPRAGDTVTFTVTPVSDPDGTIARYEWDLDGNGSFETTTAGTQATRAYPAAGTVHVAVRYVDDGHEPSPSSAHDVAVSPSSQGGDGTTPPDPSGGGGTGPGADVTAPTARPAPSALRFRRRAARLRITLDEPARVTATLASHGTLLARGDRSLRAGAGSLTLRLTKKGAARLRRARSHRLRAKLTLVVRDAAGNRRTVRRTLTIRL